MEGVASQHYQCRGGHNRRRCTLACKENLSGPILVGRLEYNGSSGEHGFDLHSTQGRLIS